MLQVRRLVAACLVKMYALGDSLPLYSRVSALQQFLTSKEAAPRGSPESVRLGALECLAALCGAHGRLLGASMPDSMAAAVRHAGRWELDAASWQQRAVHHDVDGCILTWRAVSCAQRCICHHSKCRQPLCPCGSCDVRRSRHTLVSSAAGDSAASWASSSCLLASLRTVLGMCNSSLPVGV